MNSLPKGEDEGERQKRLAELGELAVVLAGARAPACQRVRTFMVPVEAEPR